MAEQTDQAGRGAGVGGGARGGMPGDWTPHRRDDGELVGWIRPAGEEWAAIDVLGREVVTSVDWLDAETALEERGLAFLADPWMLERDGQAPLRVRLLEVTPARVVVKAEDYGDVSRASERVVVKAEDYGDVSRASERITLAWPLPARLRPPRPSDAGPFVRGARPDSSPR